MKLSTSTKTSEVPPILNSWVMGAALRERVGEYVVLALPERSGYQDVIVQADMLVQLAKYGLTFADIKEWNRFEVKTEWWIPWRGAYAKWGKRLLKIWGSTLTFTVNTQGSFILDNHTLGGREWTFTNNTGTGPFETDGTFQVGTQFDYITSEGRMRSFARNHATLRIVHMKKL